MEEIFLCGESTNRVKMKIRASFFFLFESVGINVLHTSKKVSDKQKQVVKQFHKCFCSSLHCFCCLMSLKRRKTPQQKYPSTTTTTTTTTTSPSPWVTPSFVSSQHSIQHMLQLSN
jgi:hypothetical protein